MIALRPAVRPRPLATVRAHLDLGSAHDDDVRTGSPETPDRNLALELVRVTEAAAMAAARWVGRGDKNGADGAAVNAMRAARVSRCRCTASS